MMNRDVMNRQMFQNGGYVRMEEGGPAREPTVVESLVEVMRGGSTADVDRFISQNMEMLSQSGNPFAMRAVDDFMRRNAPAPRAPMGAPMPPVRGYQDGGMAMPAPMPAAPGPMGMAGAPMPAAPSPEQMAAIPFEQAQQMAMQQGIDPAAVEAMLMDVSGKMQNLDNAQNYEEVINGIRETDAPLSVRYAELASIVGKEDADQTPESVLTLVQPVVMMAGVDQGIGSLASEEMTAPVTGDMAGGIMSTVNMGAEEAPPVNFNQGGAVQYFAPQNANRVAMPGGRLGELYGEKRDLYRSIMGAADQAQALEEQRNMTQAQMLFDIAQGALSFAGGAGKPGGSPGEQLAAAFTPVLGNIGARAGELQKFKQAQAKEARAMDIAALTAAESGLTAEQKAASDLAKQRLIGAQDLAKLDLKSRLDTAREANTEQLRQRGALTLEGAKQANRLGLESAQQENRKAIEALRQSGSQADLVLADKLQKENLQIRHDLDLNKMGVANTYELGKIDKLHLQASALQDSRLKLQEAIAANRLEFDKAQATLSNAREDQRTGIQQQLADLKDRETKLKESAAKIDTFGKSLQGKVKNLLEGEGSADLAERYKNNQTLPDETNQIEGAIGYYTNPQKVWNAEMSVYEMVAPNKLISVWEEALKTRAGIKGASMPPIGQAERDRLGLMVSPRADAGAGTGTGTGTGTGAGGGVSVEGATYESLTKDIASIGAIGDLTGRSAALQSWLNRASEVAVGTPFFKNTAKAQNLVQTLNTTATADIMRALPGKESEQFRKEIKEILPPVAAFTSGSEVALNKTRAFEAYLNQQISALNRSIESPQPMANVGALRQNAQILESYRDIYKKLGNMLEAGGASEEDKARRPPLSHFMRPLPEKEAGGK
jgi:hypothetical protein